MPSRQLLRDRPSSPRGTVYLLHFDVPYKHAKHYLGWTAEIDRRLVEHASAGCNAARLLQVVAAAGIGWRIARVWEDATRRRERQLKNRGGASRLCPICQAVTPSSPEVCA